MVFVNIVGADAAELPFGGVKGSGFGRELGRYATASADYCKLKKAEAKAAAQGEGFSQPHVAHDSFRVLPANRCNGMSAKKIEGTAASLEALPFCE